MKLYRLGENEIRIHLTPEDLCRFAVTLEDFDYDSTKGKRVIWELFDRAREETGFDAAKEKVYIQLYPKKNGGCEIFVTKLNSESEERDCYRFDDFDSFYEALGLLKEIAKETDLFRENDADRYYVLLPPHLTPARFSEFGEKLKEAPGSVFLKSRCRTVRHPERIGFYGAGEKRKA